MVHMIPKLKVGTLQLQDNCMLHIKQLIKPACSYHVDFGDFTGFTTDLFI